MRFTRRSLDAFPGLYEVQSISNQTLYITQSLCGHTGKFQHLRRQILENSSGINSSFSSDADVVLCSLLEITVYTTDGELRYEDGW